MIPAQQACLAELVALIVSALDDRAAVLDRFVLLTLAPAKVGDTVEARTIGGQQSKQWRPAIVDSVIFSLAGSEPHFSFYVRFANKNGEWSRRLCYVGDRVRPLEAGTPA